LTKFDRGGGELSHPPSKETVMEFWTSTRRLLTALLCVGGVAAYAQPAQKVSIGVSSPSLPAAGARIAKEMGLFEKHGVDAKVVQMDSASVSTMSLISGSVDFITSSPSDVVVSQARGQKLVAVGSVYHSFAPVVVISTVAAGKLKLGASAPIEARLKALDGLLIASPSATSPYTLALTSALESVGVKPRFTFMTQPAMVAALETGAIQAFIASSPFYARPVVNQTALIWVNGPNGEFPTASSQANSVTLNTKLDYAKKNPDLVKKVAAAFADLSRAIDDRPADVKAAILKLFPELDAKTLELLFKNEYAGFKTLPLTPRDMAREIAFVKLSGVPIPGIENIDPAGVLYP
jgi:ABC-type nitrate/sulfonate/bicarbonate transport system substrate-binding protein